MNQSKKVLIYSLAILLLITLFYLFQKLSFVFFWQLFFGFVLGNIILEFDHLIYWYLISPNIQESQIAKKLINQKNIKKIYHFYLKTKNYHQSLILHHFYTQICLIIVSVFILTSAEMLLSKSLVFFLGLNLFIKQVIDYQQNKTFLQSWLFARMPQQLSQNSLIYYLSAIGIFNFFFLAKVISL